MTIESNGHEHELEPEYGLPEALPTGERLLWQGTPDVRALANGAFHLRTLAIYFAVLLVLHVGSLVADGASLAAVLVGTAWAAGLALLALAAVGTLAWLTARTAVYTLTNKRVVMRIGIVLTLTYNLPLRMIDAAGLRKGAGTAGDLVLTLRGPDHIAWLNLWPHVRPWRVARPEPMLRAVPDAAHVAALLSQAWREANAGAEQQAAAGNKASASHGVSAPASTTPGLASGAKPTHWQPSPT